MHPSTMAKDSPSAFAGNFDEIFARFETPLNISPLALHSLGPASKDVPVDAGSHSQFPTDAIDSIQEMPSDHSSRPIHARVSSESLDDLTQSRDRSLYGQVSHQTAQLERQKSLGEYFASETIPKTRYTDEDLENIADLLLSSGREPWSRAPRIYTVLRHIGQLHTLDTFLDSGITDLFLPLNKSQFPKALSISDRDRFLEVQSIVLTKIIDLENRDVKKHVYFDRSETFPMTVEGKLGKGGYGSVDQVSSPRSKKVYARKRFRRTNTKQSDIESFLTELNILKRIDHHHCVRLVASYTDSKYFGLLIEPVCEADLSVFLDNVTRLSEQQNLLRTFFGCLAQAIAYLHEEKIRHRDIKPENILVKGSALYLADFGISLDWQNLSRSTTTEDTGKSWKYCAPEVAHYQKRNSSSDMWSLGCVFLEMFTVLKGVTIAELNKTLSAASGRTRYYENLNTIMIWLDRIVGDGFISDNEVAKWIRKMIVEDPASRVEAKSLAESVALYKTKKRDRQEQNTFCCEDCRGSYDMDSSSEDLPEDDGFDAKVSGNQTTPATSPVGTDKLKRYESHYKLEPSARPIANPRVDAKGLKTSLRAVEAEEENPDNSIKSYDETLADVINQHSSNVSLNSQPDVTEEVRTRDTQTRPQSTAISGDVGREPTTNDEISDRARKEDELIITASSKEDNVPLLNTAKHNEANDTTSTSTTSSVQYPLHSVPIRTPKELQRDLPAIKRRLLEEVCKNFQPWPFAHVEGQVSNLNASIDWTSPPGFVASIRKNSPFMDYVKPRHAALFDLFQNATLTDIVPMLHLLLLNGLDIGRNSFSIPLIRNKEKSTLVAKVCSKDWNSLKSHLDIVKLLICFGATPEKMHHKGDCPLALACFYGSISLVKLFLELNCHLDSKIAFRGLSPLMNAASRGDLTFVHCLMDTGFYHNLLNIHVNAFGKQGVLHVATESGHADVVEYFIGKGADVNKKDGYKRTPLHVAAQYGKDRVVEILLKNGADVYKEDWVGKTSLHLAAEFGKDRAVEVLLKNGADIYKEDLAEKTPLCLAAESGQSCVVEILLKNSANISTKDEPMKKPLVNAASRGHLEVVNLLISHGADPTRRAWVLSWSGFSGPRKTKKTPLQAARANGHDEVVSYLQRILI